MSSTRSTSGWRSCGTVRCAIFPPRLTRRGIPAGVVPRARGTALRSEETGPLAAGAGGGGGSGGGAGGEGAAPGGAGGPVVREDRRHALPRRLRAPQTLPVLRVLPARPGRLL